MIHIYIYEDIMLDFDNISENHIIKNTYFMILDYIIFILYIFLSYSVHIYHCFHLYLLLKYIGNDVYCILKL